MRTNIYRTLQISLIAGFIFLTGCTGNKKELPCEMENELLMQSIQTMKKEIEVKKAEIVELKKNEANAMTFMIEILGESEQYQAKLAEIEPKYQKLQTEYEKLANTKSLAPEQNNLK